MERDKLFFVITLVAIAILNLAMWRYVTLSDQVVADGLRQDLTAAVTGIRDDYDVRINQHTVRMNLLEQDLQDQTTSLRDELGGSVSQISSTLQSVQQQSQAKISELENQLLSMDVRSADFSNVISDVIQSVVSIRTSSGGGSGVFVDSRGYLITNHHVVSGQSDVQVVTYKRGTFAGKVVGSDPTHDIAVVKVDADVPSTKFGDSGNIEVGHKVVALGSPGGLDFTASEGIISARRQDSRGVEYFQMDVPVNPGNSGGPIISNRGRIVGVTQSKISELEGVGFAITSNDIDDIVEEIIAQHAG